MGEVSPETFVCIYCHGEHPMDAETCPETGTALHPIHKLTGTTLEDKYLIKDIIGEGGMGVIYASEHKTIGKRLAIKFLNPDLRQSEEAYKRFKREAQASAIIAHKNIVDVVDIGETEKGIPYIIMEFLSGHDLGRRIAEWGRIPLGEARDITVQVLEALAAVHSCGVVHRDLKPENIFLARQSGGSEIVKVLDFGISRLSRQEGQQNFRLTRAGYVYGTPNYIAPEQAEGKANVDHRADLYSAGMILYEMVTGQLPFTGDSYGKLLVDIITKPVPVPRNYFPDIPASLVNFLLLSLEKDPNIRFQSAQEMLREIKSVDLAYAAGASSSSSSGERSSISSMSTGGRRRITPIREISEKKHRDFSTPKKERTRSSSYKIVTGGRTTASHRIGGPTPHPEEGKAEAKEAVKDTTPPPAQGPTPPPGGRRKTSKTPYRTRKSTQPKPALSGSYRIISASSDKVFDSPKHAADRKTPAKEKEAAENEDKGKDAVPSKPPTVEPQFSGSYARITRARTLPSPGKAVVKKNHQRKHQDVTPTPDMGEEDGS
jgi:serine/threonine protein kinase